MTVEFWARRYLANVHRYPLGTSIEAVCAWGLLLWMVRP